MTGLFILLLSACGVQVYWLWTRQQRWQPYLPTVSAWCLTLSCFLVLVSLFRIFDRLEAKESAGDASAHLFTAIALLLINLGTAGWRLVRKG